MKCFLVAIALLVVVLGTVQADSECGERIAQACADDFEGIDEEDVDCGTLKEVAECIGGIRRQCDDLSIDEIKQVDFVHMLFEGLEELCEEGVDYDDLEKRGRKRGYRVHLKRGLKRAFRRALL